MQKGPIYFLTPRKCSVFGVHCEAKPRQINFLTDESDEVRKGANAVISRLHYFFDVHCLGETDVFLHADNYTGQNKNNAMMNYLMWRVMTGRHTNITLLIFGCSAHLVQPGLVFWALQAPLQAYQSRLHG